MKELPEIVEKGFCVSISPSSSRLLDHVGFAFVVSERITFVNIAKWAFAPSTAFFYKQNFCERPNTRKRPNSRLSTNPTFKTANP